MKTRQSSFTLIEIVLALGVVGIGMVAIMGLFPIATNASRDAIGYTHAADSADTFLQLLKNNARNDWSEITGLQDSRPEHSDPLEPPLGDEGMPGSRGTIHDPELGVGLFQVVSFSGATPDDDDPDHLPADAIIDFNGIVAVWRSQVTINEQTLPNNIAARLNVEVSWPAQRPYKNREKELYTLELFNR